MPPPPPLLLLLLLSAASASASTSPSDVAALAAFKAAISPSSINPLSCLASWDFGSSPPADPCSPSPSRFVCGLSCSADRVTAVVLDPAGYSGPLSPSLANLTLLSHLDLSNNAFHGPLPPPTSSLSSLRSLVLASNAFSGPIPPFLSALSSLQTLDLTRNAFTGPIPESLASLRSLETLDLSFNRLSGALPASLPPNLVVLALRGNAIAGTLKKSTFSPLRRLEVAELAANRLEGKLGGWFLLLPSLQQVNLANNSLNQLEVWAAGGGGGGGSQLVAVDFGFNRFEGEIPGGLAGYPSLAALSLRHNRLRGAIPWQYYYAKKGAPFRRLFLDGNFLKGRVPDGFLGGGGGDGGGVYGSFGDNCLDGCPAKSALCSPAQKPNWLCKQVYGRPL